MLLISMSFEQHVVLNSELFVVLIKMSFDQFAVLNFELIMVLIEMPLETCCFEFLNYFWF